MSKCSERVSRLAPAFALCGIALAGGVAVAAAATAPARSPPVPSTHRPATTLGFGKPATAEEIAGWDIDVRPDGTGLPAGSGTVRKGQDLYDAQCASCHGTFGESNAYMVLAGGVGTLASDQPIRTTGSKLNYATTLWDYINRAMPFANPKTLAVDEVYALTAYVLHLNDLLPADGALDRDSLVALRMPNRDGFTTAHGMMSVKGKPDTSNVACMKDCVKEVRLSSEFPEHARDSHGNLAEQSRALGPVEGSKAAGTAAPAAVAANAAGPSELAKAAGCMACHGLANRIVGPSYREIAARYAPEREAPGKLVAKVKQGGAGVWGTIPMPAHRDLKDADISDIVAWILGGAK